MKLKNDFLGALLKEIVVRKDYLERQTVDTVYFGGGTPSLLAEDDLHMILDSLRLHHTISPFAEITFEANPDDITTAKLIGWKQNGINRLSIGIQSFFEEDLKWMNRAHSAAQAYDCVIMAQDQGIENISIDLIYGTPSLSDEKWERNLDTAMSLRVPHLSCYALTVEPGTALEVLTRQNKIAGVSSDDQARQFLILIDYLQNKGYEHYEISNFALAGKRSQHNSSYWQGKSYLGLGPSAHSFNGHSRQWNVSNNALYIGSLLKNELPFESETLTTIQRFNEYIMTSLRTMEGVEISNVLQHFGKRFSDPLIIAAAPFIQKAWLFEESGFLKLTREGKLFGDRISSALFAE